MAFATPEGGTGIIVVLKPANDGGISVAGMRHRVALLCDACGAGADQLCLLIPHRPRARRYSD
jgi:hypothetical protein